MSAEISEKSVYSNADDKVKSALVSLEDDDEFEDFPVEGGYWLSA